MAKNSTKNILLFLLQLFLSLIPVITAIITFSYLGMSLGEPDMDIDPDDWRRKWLVFFAWITIVAMILNILTLSLYVRM